jgi:hypothetical protein
MRLIAAATILIFMIILTFLTEPAKQSMNDYAEDDRPFWMVVLPLEWLVAVMIIITLLGAW